MWSSIKERVKTQSNRCLKVKKRQLHWEGSLSVAFVIRVHTTGIFSPIFGKAVPPICEEKKGWGGGGEEARKVFKERGGVGVVKNWGF